MKWIGFCDFLFILSTAGSIFGQEINPEPENKINISLANFNSSIKNGQAFHTQDQLLPLKTNLITVTNIPPSVSFLIIQVHTQDFNITLAYNQTTKVSGSNIGLEINSNAIRFTEISVTNPHDQLVACLVAIVAYTSEAPKPGGCNMEFEVEVSPYQKLFLTDATIQIDAQPASSPFIRGKKLPCENNFITYETYRLYIPEWDFTAESYFSSLIKMLTVEDIIRNGEKIPPGIFTSVMRRVYSAYPGTGSVYAMIATFNDNSAAYVPSFSYGCSPRDDEESCMVLNNTLSKILCALILFVGFFLTFVGHRCFQSEMFILASFSGGIIGSTILYSIGINNSTLQIGLTILIGLVVGIIWNIIYNKFEMPCIAILQASMFLGALVASTTYFGMPDDVSAFKDDTTFWIIYASIIVMVPLFLCISPMNSNVVCCAFLGSCAIILPIDYWLGSNLKYIIINTIRRITVAGFNIATIHPPFQNKDAWLSAFWVLLALFGMHVQRRNLEGRAPFPNRNNFTTIISETHPILSESRNGRRVLVIRENDGVYRSSMCCWG